MSEEISSWRLSLKEVRMPQLLRDWCFPRSHHGLQRFHSSALRLQQIFGEILRPYPTEELHPPGRPFKGCDLQTQLILGRLNIDWSPLQIPEKPYLKPNDYSTALSHLILMSTTKDGMIYIIQFQLLIVQASIFLLLIASSKALEVEHSFSIFTFLFDKLLIFGLSTLLRYILFLRVKSSQGSILLS